MKQQLFNDKSFDYKYINCKICGDTCKDIEQHLSKHHPDISIIEYIKRYPNAPVKSKWEQEKRAAVKSLLATDKDDILTLLKAYSLVKNRKMLSPNALKVINNIKANLIEGETIKMINENVNSKEIKKKEVLDNLFTPPVPEVSIPEVTVPEAETSQTLGKRRTYGRQFVEPTPDEIEGYDYIRCHICGNPIRSDMRIHLKRNHPEISIDEYKIKYPTAQICIAKRAKTLDAYLDVITAPGYNGRCPMAKLDDINHQVVVHNSNIQPQPEVNASEHTSDIKLPEVNTKSISKLLQEIGQSLIDLSKLL